MAVLLPHADWLYRSADFAECIRWRNRTQDQGAPPAPCDMLDKRELNSSLAVTTHSLTALASKLASGRAVRIAAIGASLTQQGGCIEQNGRCTQYSGGGRPGWLLRFFQWLNATWPNSHHFLFNGGRDMTPAGGFVGCLYTWLPRALDLVVLEFGSMAYAQKIRDMDLLVRTLRSLPRPPALLFLTARPWCHTRPNGSTVLLEQYNQESRHQPDRGEGVEHYCDFLATESRQSAISMHRALRDRVYADRLRGRCPFQKHGTLPLSVPDVAHDGTHAFASPLGDAHLAAAMAHWLHRLVTRRSEAQRPADTPDRADQGAGRGVGGGDEASMVPTALGMTPVSGHCFDLRADRSMLSVVRSPSGWSGPSRAPQTAFSAPPTSTAAGVGRSVGGDSATRNDVGLVWATEHCPQRLEECTAASSLPSTAVPSPSASAASSSAATAVSSSSSPGSIPEATDKPCALATHGLRAPPTFHYCTHALSALTKGQRRKESPGVVAMHAGATLWLRATVEGAPEDDSADSGGAGASGTAHNTSSAGARTRRITLSYLVSYEHMGIASVACFDGCTCRAVRLDAHKPSAERISAFVTRDLGPVSVARGAAPIGGAGWGQDEQSETCTLAVRVENETSSGEHKFKVRSVVVY